MSKRSHTAPPVPAGKVTLPPLPCLQEPLPVLSIDRPAATPDRRGAPSEARQGANPRDRRLDRLDRLLARSRSRDDAMVRLARLLEDRP